MGDRFIIVVECPSCGKVTEDVYYAPTCNFTEFECDCGYVIDLADYTGISYEDASNRDLIEGMVENLVKWHLGIIGAMPIFQSKDDRVICLENSSSRRCLEYREMK